MTPEDAAEERVDDDVEEAAEEPVFLLDEADEARASAESDVLTRVVLRDVAGMFVQVGTGDEDEGVGVKDRIALRSICDGE